MKKQLRNIIISLCVVVVLVAGVVSVNLLMPKKNSSSSSASSSTPEISVYKTDVKNITMVHIKTEKDDVIVRQSNGKYSVDGLDQKLLNEDSASTIFSTASNITAEKVIDENASDLSQYGLDKPSVTVDIVSSDKTVTVEIGKETLTKDGNYMKLKDSSKVYKITAAETNSLDYVKTDLVKLSICGFDSANAAKLTDITLGGSARPQPIVLKIDPSSVSSSSGSSSVSYLMKSPATYPLNDENISTITSALQSLSANAVVSLDVSDANLEKYGLKNPKYTLTAVYNGNKMVLRFGTPYKEDSSTLIPIYLEGTPAIYNIADSTVSFYDWQLDDVTDSLLYTEFIDNIKSITVSKGSENYTINLSGTGTDLKGTYNSKELNTDNLRKFYEKFLEIKKYGTATRPANASTYAKVVVTYREASRKATTIEFITIDNRKCLYSLDGQAHFYIYTSDVDKMLNAIRDLIAGKTISD